MTTPPFTPHAGGLTHLVLQVACAEPQSRRELAQRIERRHDRHASVNALKKATRRLCHAGLLRATERGRYVLTHLGEAVLDDLDIELWWRSRQGAA